MVSSIADNGGRSCINASAVVVPKYAAEIADALARSSARSRRCRATMKTPGCSAFANPKMAEGIDAAIEEGLRDPGAWTSLPGIATARARSRSKAASICAQPSFVCDSFAHPLANREFLFPYASVVQVPQAEMLKQIGPSLVVTAITEDPLCADGICSNPLDRPTEPRPHLHDADLLGPAARRQSVRISFTAAARSNLPDSLLYGQLIPMRSSFATTPFDYQPRTRVVFGVESVERVGELAAELSARKILLVTDPGIVSAGHAGRVIALLETQGLQVVCFDQVEENPTTQCVGRCVEVARSAGIDTIVGLGGGSSMDTAKGCNFILTNGGQMKDYWGVGKAKLPMLPLIAIPTTGGTGSECQSFALITDEGTHQKMACGDPKAAARIAILDPALTVSQPARVTACSGIDAIAHAVETAVTKRRTHRLSSFRAKLSGSRSPACRASCSRRRTSKPAGGCCSAPPGRNRHRE